MKPKLRDRAPSTDPTTMRVEDPENMLTALVSGGSDRNRFLMEVCIQSSDFTWNLSTVYMFHHISRTFLHIQAIVGLETQEKSQKDPI